MSGRWIKEIFRSLIFVVTMGTCSLSHGASPKSAVQSFGIVGTWSTDCAIIFKAGGRDVARVIFAAPFFGTPTMTLQSVGQKAETFFRWEIQSAAQVTDDKLTMTVEILDQTAKAADGKEMKLDIFDPKPLEFAPLLKTGKQLQMRFPQSTGPMILEKCLQ